MAVRHVRSHGSPSDEWLSQAGAGKTRWASVLNNWPTRKTSAGHFRLTPVLLTLTIISMLVAGCRDVTEAFVWIIVNESQQSLVVHYDAPTSAGESIGVRIEPRTHGLGLSGSNLDGREFTEWKGATVSVFTMECSLVGEVRVNEPTASVLVTESLEVRLIPAEETPTESSGEQLPVDGRCR